MEQERGLYDGPLDFKKLAAKFPDFRKHCKLQPSGKIIFEFESDEGVRALTKAILKEDFDLDVNIPPGSLVPRIPSRFNYLRLLNDLIRMNNITGAVSGVDIGTGTSCIYALLGARHFGWSFIATDSNKSSLEAAKQNVVSNGLEHLISVQKADEEGILPSTSATFTMCNPPFYQEHETDEKFVNYNGSMMNTTPGVSATTANRNELETSGGEVAFVTRMIGESQKMADEIKFFTSLLGRKSSLKVLKRRLESIESVRYSVAKLEQGKTHRWVLIWSFSDVWLEKEHSSIPWQKADRSGGLDMMELVLKGLKIHTSRTVDGFGVAAIIGRAEACTWSRDCDAAPERKRPRKSPSRKYVLQFRISYDDAVSSFRLFFLQGSRPLLNSLKQYVFHRK